MFWSNTLPGNWIHYVSGHAVCLSSVFSFSSFFFDLFCIFNIFLFLGRTSELDETQFSKLHDSVKRRDIVGVTGCPGLCIGTCDVWLNLLDSFKCQKNLLDLPLDYIFGIFQSSSLFH